MKLRVIRPRPVNTFLYFAAAFFLSVITAFGQAAGQAIGPLSSIEQGPKLTCRIDRISPQNRMLAVSCAAVLPEENYLLRFADQFAGIDRLSERVYGLKIRDEKGAILLPEIRGGGLYSFNAPGRRRITIEYEARLARALNPSQYALVSSLGNEAGFLMLGDLMPRLCAAGTPEANCEEIVNQVQLQIIAPQSWGIATTEKENEDRFEISDPRRAVFFLGRLRERTVTVGATRLRVAIAGAWGFADQDVFRLAEAIGREQAAIIGGDVASDCLITLAPFPQPLTGLRSSAITLGRTGALMLNPNDDAAATFAHYRRHLAHEMFHFYLPNAFLIRENFDWFWEGFTRYTALLTLARLRLIGMREYMDSIGAEYEAYWFNPLRNQVSLIEASPEKFSNLASYDLIYRKGMLVAALYDLELRWQSGGKLNLADVMRSLYQRYAVRGIPIGNRETLDEMRRAGDFQRLIRDDIETSREIDLNARIKRYGLVMEWSAMGRGRAVLMTAAKLSARQRALLAGLAPALTQAPSP